MVSGVQSILALDTNINEKSVTSLTKKIHSKNQEKSRKPAQNSFSNRFHWSKGNRLKKNNSNLNIVSSSSSYSSKLTIVLLDFILFTEQHAENDWIHFILSTQKTAIKSTKMVRYKVHDVLLCCPVKLSISISILRERKSNLVHENLCEIAPEWNFNLSSEKKKIIK